MAKTNIPSILEVHKKLKSNGFLPIYFLCGEDAYNIDITLKLILKKINPLITSDFDKETFYGENNNFVDVLSVAQAFPFGSEKKLIVFKQAEKPRDKKELVRYIQSPPDFSVVVCIYEGKISNPDSEPYKSLLKSGYLFEAKELKGKHMTDWLIGEVDSRGKKIDTENAELMIDIVGENRQLLEAQLDKIILFLGEKKEISLESITSLSTSAKEFSIFDLQNAIGQKKKDNTLKIAYNLLESGTEVTAIVAMLTKYFSGLAKISELQQSKMPDQQAARIVGTHPYYYKNYVSARRNFSDQKIVEIFRALFKADLSTKTTSTEPKTVLTLLVGEIFE